MNKLVKGMILCAFIISSSITASATDTTTETSSEPSAKIGVGAGLTPQSPLYFLDKGMEDLRLWLSSEEKDQELLLSFAEERLSELKKLDEDKAIEYADQLYEEYGKNLDKVNNYVAKQMVSGNADKVGKIKEKLDRVSEVDQAVDTKDVTNELKEKVRDIQTKTYAISIVTNLDATQVETLKEQGFGNGEILKLQAFAELSGKTIEELTFLDIYKNNDEEEKEIDFGKLAIELGMVELDENGDPIVDDEGEFKPDLDAVKDKFKEYKNFVKETEKELKELKENAKEREEKLKEIEKKKEEVRKEVSDKVNEKLNERLSDFNTKIDEIYNAKLQIISELDETVVTAERKAELIIKLDEVKVKLVQKVTEKVLKNDLEPKDLGKLNAEIHKEFNQLLEEELSLTDDEKAELEESFSDVSNQVKPLFDQIIVNYQKSHSLSFTEEQIHFIWREVKEKIEDQEDIENLDDEVLEVIEEVLDNNPEGNTVNVDTIFNDLLSNTEFNSLDEANLALFKQELLDAKVEILADIDANQSAINVKFELIEEFKERLVDFKATHEIADTQLDTMFNDILNDRLFRFLTQLDDAKYEEFKQILLLEKETLLSELDTSKNDYELKRDMQKLFLEKLESMFQDSDDSNGNKRH